MIYAVKINLNAFVIHHLLFEYRECILNISDIFSQSIIRDKSVNTSRPTKSFIVECTTSITTPHMESRCSVHVYKGLGSVISIQILFIWKSSTTFFFFVTTVVYGSWKNDCKDQIYVILRTLFRKVFTVFFK